MRCIYQSDIFMVPNFEYSLDTDTAKFYVYTF